MLFFPLSGGLYFALFYLFFALLALVSRHLATQPLFLFPPLLDWATFGAMVFIFLWSASPMEFFSFSDVHSFWSES